MKEAMKEAEGFKRFVRQHLPAAVRAKIRYEYEILDYGDALYPDYSLEAIEVELPGGEVVRLDRVIDERAENDPAFVEAIPEDDAWTGALATGDDTLMHELLKPLVAAAHDPYLKQGVLEFDLAEAA